MFESLRLDALARAVLRSAVASADARTVDFALVTQEVARLPGSDHTYDDPYVIVQLSDGSQGYSFAHPKDVEPSDLHLIAGAHVTEIPLELPPALLAATIDAICGPVLIRPGKTFVLTGLSDEKSRFRAQAIRSLLPKQYSRIAFVGGIEDLVINLRSSDSEVRIADFHLAGSLLDGVQVETDYQQLLRWCEVAVVTGNILKTDTLANIVTLLASKEKFAILYSMTGHNLYPRIIEDLPFNHITSESFPFYWYANTTSTLRVYTSKATLNPRV